jgi:hypothetical protein
MLYVIDSHYLDVGSVKKFAAFIDMWENVGGSTGIRLQPVQKLALKSLEYHRK